ncbi:elongator complex protein 5 isoform X1 [Stigmatopora nigra]
MVTSFSIMLRDLLQGTEAGGFLIIQDSCCYSARRLLWSFIKAALNREEDVHVLSFEVSEEELKNGLKGSPVQRLHFHDGYSDPLAWFDQSALTAERFCAQSVERGSRMEPALWVIDSLSWILRHVGPTTVCQTLRRLREGKHKMEDFKKKCPERTNGNCVLSFVSGSSGVIGLLHHDMHPRGTVGSLCHFATSTIAITAGARGARAKITKRLKSGKVLQDEELFSIDHDLMVIGQSKASRMEPEEEEVDPTANLTFNLRLSDAQREAKEKLALPFVFTKEKKAALLHTGTGRIVYEPDANDDYDQEDPDDDLDV